MATPLADLFAAAWPADAAPLPGPSEIEPALENLVRRGKAAAPTVEVSLPRVARAVASRAADGGADVVAAIASLDAAELWLACGCAQGRPDALADFDARYIAGLHRTLAHMKLDDAALDDVRQTVRHKLLLPGDDGLTKLEAYAGQGGLAALVRVVAVRTALDQIRASKRRPDQPAVDAGDAADALLTAQTEPEMRLIQQRHSAAFKAAFQNAIAELSAKDRGILRLHLLDRLGIDDISALHGVHRATAARWLGKIREGIGKATREHLRAHLDLSPEQFDSLYRAVDTHLDLSFSRILAPEAPG